jgi:hypothetical protein
VTGGGRSHSCSDALIDKSLRAATPERPETSSVSLIIVSAISPIEMKRWFIWNMNEVSSYMPGPTPYKPRYSIVSNGTCREHLIGIIAARRSGDYPSCDVSCRPCRSIQD